MSTRIYGLALSILTSVAFSCSGDGGGGRSNKPEEPASPYKEYAIHVVARTKKGELLLEFPPMAALSAPGTSSAPKSSTASTAEVAGPGSIRVTPASDARTRAKHRRAARPRSGGSELVF